MYAAHIPMMKPTSVPAALLTVVLAALLASPSPAQGAKKKRPAASAKKRKAPRPPTVDTTPTFEPDPVTPAAPQASDSELVGLTGAPAAKKKDTSGAGRSPLTALHVALGPQIFSRNFSYSNDSAGVLPVYELAAAAQLVLHADWYPGAHFTSKWPSHLGLLLDADVGLGVKSKNAAGTIFSNQVWGVSAAAQGRIPLPLRTSEFNLHLGYTHQRYAFEDAAAEPRPLIPNVTYQALRLGVGTYLSVHDRIGVSLLFSYLYPFATGELSRSVFFPHATAHGIDLDLFVHARLWRGLELQGGFEMRMWLISMNTQPTDTYVIGGATDRFLAGTLRIAYRL